MALLDLQEMEIPEAPGGALMASWSDSNSNGGESNISLLLCG
ncbi:MAG: SapB/AmfS family lanthipeptide [Pseudonocardiaceae bacterium]